MINKIIIICFLLFIGYICLGCDGYNNDETTNNITNNESTNDEKDIDTNECLEYNLDRIACTTKFLDEDGYISSEPYIVSNRIFDHAKSAIKQCFNYEQVYFIYSTAMEYLNGKQNPEKVEEWFMKTMREMIGYEPYQVCPGGCNT